MNSLAMTLSAEEPDVTTISIRPGMVDTEMQRELREVHNAERFVQVHQEGKLLKPQQPGNVMARLVSGAPKDLSGKFIT